MGQHQARMIQAPFPPEEKIQIQCAWTPLRLKIPVTTKPSLKLMKLREQLQCRSFAGGALHTCKEHHSIANSGCPGGPPTGAVSSSGDQEQRISPDAALAQEITSRSS